jgi:hypothetical protein
MAACWSVLGAISGIDVAQTASNTSAGSLPYVLSGMMVLSMIGAALGLISEQYRASFVGAMLGMIGAFAISHVLAMATKEQSLTLGLIVGGLVGATAGPVLLGVFSVALALGRRLQPAFVIDEESSGAPKQQVKHDIDGSDAA